MALSRTARSVHVGKRTKVRYTILSLGIVIRHQPGPR